MTSSFAIFCELSPAGHTSASESMACTKRKASRKLKTTPLNRNVSFTCSIEYCGFAFKMEGRTTLARMDVSDYRTVMVSKICFCVRVVDTFRAERTHILPYFFTSQLCLTIFKCVVNLRFTRLKKRVRSLSFSTVSK